MEKMPECVVLLFLHDKPMPSKKMMHRLIKDLVEFPDSLTDDVQRGINGESNLKKGR